VESFVRRLAVEKAQAGFNSMPENNVWVVGGDTVVAVDGHVLGKPRSEADYRRMMQLLSGCAHQVLSGLAVVHDGVVHSTVNISTVWFAELSEQEIVGYWQSGEPQDKAGGYGIQGYAGKWVRKIEGSYTGIMGLPLYELDQLLKESEFYE
jgi:septum formation protein